MTAAEATRFGAEGIEIEAGSLGDLTVSYPVLQDEKQQPQGKLLEKTIAGRTASLKYQGGAQLDLTLGEDGTVTMRFLKAPTEVKFLGVEMHLPIALNQGGSWKLDGKGADFPKEKPAAPHLFQGHARTLELTNYEGRTLSVGVPDNSWLQLTDNREWNWGIFNWRAFVPYDAGRNEVTLKIALGGSTAKARPLVDEFGQLASGEWPQKLASLEELKADVASEKAYYASLTPPATDRFGGLPGSQQKLGLKATGYFHVEKKGERTLLVDPAGDAFFHLGLCSVGPNEDYTLVKGRENAFAWLPPHNAEFESAWKQDSGGTVVSYHLANMIRKYGEPYSPAAYSSRMIERMRRWGFNSGGAFSNLDQGAREAANFPHVAHLPLGEWEGIALLPGIGQVWDPFEEKTRARIEANLAKGLPARAHDPLVIGYFIVNEPIYENVQHLVPTFKASEHACKKKLIEGLLAKYKTVAEFNAAWGLDAKSFEDLGERVLTADSAAAKADVQAFVGEFFEEYFRFIEATFRKYDSQHLLMGSRLMPGTINNEPLCRIMGKYVDVMSFNYYTNAVDLALLRRVHEWTGGRPMMLSEFYWSSSKESGLSGGREVASQEARGMAYRNYVEQSAALGFVVGIEWFTLVDQAVSGRSFQGFDGERANTGVLSVSDRPWKAMLEKMMKTNYGIYPVLLGEQPPFSWNKF